MTWLLFVLGAVLSWGLYGPALHQGQVALGNPLRALLCVGVASFLIGVLVPLAGLASQGQLGGFNRAGVIGATAGGALGALGAVCIIWAFRAGGTPTYVMPLVFGGAPLVNVLVSMWQPPKTSRVRCSVGFLLASAAIVLRYKPASGDRTRPSDPPSRRPRRPGRPCLLTGWGRSSRRAGRRRHRARPRPRRSVAAPVWRGPGA